MASNLQQGKPNSIKELLNCVFFLSPSFLHISCSSLSFYSKKPSELQNAVAGPGTALGEHLTQMGYSWVRDQHGTGMWPLAQQQSCQHLFPLSGYTTSSGHGSPPFSRHLLSHPGCTPHFSLTLNLSPPPLSFCSANHYSTCEPSPPSLVSSFVYFSCWLAFIYDIYIWDILCSFKPCTCIS